MPLRVLLLIVGTLAVLAAIWFSVATSRWNSATRTAVHRVEGTPDAVPRSPKLFANELIAGLPEPVVRYFLYAVPEGAPITRRAVVSHAGEFAVKPQTWSPFTSRQHIRVHPPAFVWDANMAMMPLIPVRVRDSYLDGAGAIKASLGGVFTLADSHGTPEIASGALARFLAESVWLPTSLLPHSGIEWAAVDHVTARATIVDGGVQVAVDFHFDELGRIVRVTSNRFRDVKGKGVLTPWSGSFTDYERINGVMIPRSGEVGWIVDGRYQPYWRGRIESIAVW